MVDNALVLTSCIHKTLKGFLSAEGMDDPEGQR